MGGAALQSKAYVKEVTKTALSEKVSKDDSKNGGKYAKGKDDNTRKIVTSVAMPSVSPMLKTKWRQGEYREETFYNKYCKYNSKDPDAYAYAGCGPVAIAQVMAYTYSKKNNGIQEIDGVKMDFKAMTSKENPYLLPLTAQENCSRLIGI